MKRLKLRDWAYAHNSKKLGAELFVAAFLGYKPESERDKKLFGNLLALSLIEGSTLKLLKGQVLVFTGRADGNLAEIIIPDHQGKWHIARKALMDAGLPEPPVDMRYAAED